jgi:hypothetical protein
VRGVSVLPATGKVEVVIDLQGAAELRDFTLTNPARLVIDLIGTRLTVPAALYDGLNRGGVKNVRYAQFKPDVVRIVIDLDALKDYQVDRSGGQVRVRIGTERTGFAAWSSSTVQPAVPVAVASRAAAPPVTGGPDQAARVTTPSVGRALSIDEYLAVHRAEAAQSQAPRITVQWDNASIEDVIAGFAAFSGRTIILGKGITGNVTAEIKNQPWDPALNAGSRPRTRGADAARRDSERRRQEELARADSTVDHHSPRASARRGRARPLGAVGPRKRQAVADSTSNALVITEVSCASMTSDS